MKTRRAISPVIAVIIIVAVTIAIAVAVAGWLMGLWGGYAKGGPQLQITYAEVTTDGNFTIRVTNKGSGTAKVDLIKVAGKTTSNGLTINNISGDATNVDKSKGYFELPGGGTATIDGSVSGTTFAAGQSVDIEIVDTSSGARAATTVPATP